MLDILSTTGTEPVSANEAAAAARLDGDAQTELAGYIDGAITAARQVAEQITGRRYIETVQRWSGVDWPAADDVIHVHAASVCAISYWTGSAWSTLSGAAYLFDADESGTVIAPITGTSWPVLGDRAVGARVRVDLTNGDPALRAVPECVRLYIKAQVAGWINSSNALERSSMTPNPMLAPLLDSEKLWA